MSHLAKFILISTTEKTAMNNFLLRSKNLLNHAHIFEKNRKVFAGNYWWNKDLKSYDAFEGFTHKNISNIIFPNKLNNLEGFPLSIAGLEGEFYDDKAYSKFTYFVEILTTKLNATLKYIKIPKPDPKNYSKSIQKHFTRLCGDGKCDIIFLPQKLHQIFQAYNFVDQCFLAPMPPKRSIYELILTLPLDKSCWMWLGITVAVSALIWRIFEGPKSHWNFLFGIFALFVGQDSNIRT